MSRIVNLSDDRIKDFYAEGRLIESSGDFNLDYGGLSKKVIPIKGGIYDANIFGSIYNNQCNCGDVRVLHKFCHECGSPVLSYHDKLKRFAYIELPYYYVSPYKIDNLVKAIRKVVHIPSVRNSGVKRIDYVFLANYSIQEDKIVASLDYSGDETHTSIEGLLELLEELNHVELPKIKSYLNKYVLVTPAILRPIKINIVDGIRRVDIHPVSAVYSAIIEASNFIQNTIAESDDIEYQVIQKAKLRKFVSNSMSSVAQSNKTSKANINRNLLSKRVANSGRATIVPNKDLDIDKVNIPFRSIYSLYRTDFIEYISDMKNVTRSEARIMYSSVTEEIVELFEEFLETKVVMINRNPTIHRLNMLAMRVGISHSNSIELPPILCAPIGGDFDGDELNYYYVPDEFREKAIREASPKSIVYYEKNLKPVFVPSHEFLYGLHLGTKVNLKEELVEYESIEEVNTDYDSGKLNPDTPIRVDAYTSTYGRLRVSTIIRTYLDDVIGENISIDPGNILKIMYKINIYEDRLDIIKHLQDFSMEMMRIIGISSINYNQLYINTDKELKNEVLSIINDEELDTAKKNFLVSEKYGEYVNDAVDKVPEGIKTLMKSSDRMKMSQLVDVSIPNLVLSDGEFHLNDKSLYDGLSPDDYAKHSINNRNILSIKQSAVPGSGYLTRQLSFLGQSYSFTEEFSDTKYYLELPNERLIERFDTNDEVIKSKTGVSKVPSIIFNDDFKIYGNQVSNRLEHNEGDNLGVNLVTSITEGITQAGLSLKHGGTFRQHLDTFKLKADDRFNNVELENNKLSVYYSSGVKHYFVTDQFIVLNTSGNKGEYIGFIDNMMSPSYVLDSLTTLIGAYATQGSRQQKNYIRRSNSISPIKGRITYKRVIRNNTNWIEVRVGNLLLDRIHPNANTLLPYPEGTLIDNYQKISSDILDPRKIVLTATNEKERVKESYMIFRAQFLELMDSMTEDNIEFLFRIITNKGKYLGVRGALDQLPIFSKLAFGYASKHLKELDDTKIHINQDDLVTQLLFMENH